MMDNKNDLSRKTRADYTDQEKEFLKSSVPLSTAKDALLPLNSLCDRLEEVKCTSQLRRFSAQIAAKLSTILGSERCRTHGINLNELTANSDDRGPIQQTAASSVCPQAEKKQMTLDEMESILNMNDDPSRDQATTSRPSKRPRWIKCKSWDACAIGSLPGYPV